MTIQEIEQKLNEMEREIKNTVNAIEEDMGNEISELRDALAKLKESKKEGKWKPKLHDKYWLRNMNGLTDWFEWFENVVDVWRYNNLPIFKTKEECERYWHFMDTVKEKSYEFSKEEWSNPGVLKFEIEYFADDESLRAIDMKKIKIIGGIYFKTEEDAQYIIDNFKDELMEYLV